MKVSGFLLRAFLKVPATSTSSKQMSTQEKDDFQARLIASSIPVVGLQPTPYLVFFTI